ncbi:MAG: 50S ribosomal protein L4 [Candidatus Lokiarchaeota archaeon]|nr:50S ribosomal protein L4 [Candidatus Lokiarchaeota archaeon]
MNGQVRDIEGNVKKTIKLGEVFDTLYRPDLISRVVAASQSIQKQPQGRDPMAGKRTSAISLGVGRAQARVPRVKGAGTRTAGAGTFAPMTIGGRLSQPPRTNKVLFKKINKKEKALAFDSAIAATANLQLVKDRGHVVDGLESSILIFDDKIQTVKKTRSLVDLLEKIGLGAELERTASRSIRAGKEKRRGNKYKASKGPLIVAEKLGIHDAARNIPGVDVVPLGNLCVEHLAPGGQAGRLVIWSESSINALMERK